MQCSRQLDLDLTLYVVRDLPGFVGVNFVRTYGGAKFNAVTYCIAGQIGAWTLRTLG